MKQLLLSLLLMPVIVFANINTVTEKANREDVNANIPIPAGAVVVMRHQLGIGTPGVKGLEPANHMGEGIYHSPQYMTQYPTAGVIWSRVVDVECDKINTGEYVCDGYNWSPALGRGEYLFIRPTMKAPVCPCNVPSVVEKLVPYPVYVEVKKKKE
jgi:hypothetical protein